MIETPEDEESCYEVKLFMSSVMSYLQLESPLFSLFEHINNGYAIWYGG